MHKQKERNNKIFASIILSHDVSALCHGISDKIIAHEIEEWKCQTGPHP